MKPLSDQRPDPDAFGDSLTEDDILRLAEQEELAQLAADERRRREEENAHAESVLGASFGDLGL